MTWHTPKTWVDNELVTPTTLNEQIRDNLLHLLGVSVPTGAIMPYAGIVDVSHPLPEGWLLCDGTTYANDTYPDLAAALGQTFGGTGTNFKVPDLRGRFPLGLDNMGGANANRVSSTAAESLGGASGSETHTLTTAQIPGGASGSTAGAASTGSSTAAQAHNNMPPYLSLNYIIKT